MEYMPRPTHSYNEQGSEAYYADVKEAKNPYGTGTLAALDWTLGMRETALEDLRIFKSDSEDGDGDIEIKFHELSHDCMRIRSDRWLLMDTAMKHTPSIPSIETTINVSVAEWPMNCFAISEAIVNSGILSEMEKSFGKAWARYGIYDGEINPDSPFGNKPMARHGWIEFETGLVMDPTRFVFEAREPYIWLGSIEEYDLGANRLRAKFKRPAPDHDSSERQVSWTVNDSKVTDAVSMLLGDGQRLEIERRISIQQALWIANLPTETLGEHAPEIYRALERAGCAFLIPLDNRIQSDGPRMR